MNQAQVQVQTQISDLFVVPSDTELQNLREQIASAKRMAEYAQLKKDLKEIVSTSVNTPNELEGMMQIPDTEKVLKTKREKSHFFELLLERLHSMFSVRPIIGNIIALLIASVALYYIFDETEMSQSSQGFFAAAIEIFAAIQIIKSATRGLLLPFLALLIGCSIAHMLTAHQTFLHFNKIFYEHLMVVGIIGLGVAVLCID